jgi:hypothetical protein
MLLVRQSFPERRIPDFAGEVRRQLAMTSKTQSHYATAPRRLAILTERGGSLCRSVSRSMIRNSPSGSSLFST